MLRCKGAGMNVGGCCWSKGRTLLLGGSEIGLSSKNQPLQANDACFLRKRR